MPVTLNPELSHGTGRWNQWDF